MDTNLRLLVRIAVYRAVPEDYQKYRHTALWFEFNDGSAPFLIHAVGPNMDYRVEVRNNYDPTGSQLFVAGVSVGWFMVPISKGQLILLVSKTPINNSTTEFNCQIWVGDALRRLAEGGYIQNEEYMRAVDGMIDVTMEASDEPA